MREEESVRLERQLRQLCAFLPTLARDAELRALLAIHERGATHMLHSANARRILDEVEQHIRTLRKLALVLARECQVNLAQHAATARR